MKDKPRIRFSILELGWIWNQTQEERVVSGLEIDIIGRIRKRILPHVEERLGSGQGPST